MGSSMRAREPPGFRWNFHFDLPDGHIYTPKALASERNCAWQARWDGDLIIVSKAAVA